MKFIHLSDLHIGKSLGLFRLIADQRYILDRILDIIKSEAPDAVLISGDIYDRGIPPTEAVTMLDDFIVKLSKLGCPTFIISGNHDSPERLSFGSSLIAASGIHIAPVYDGNVEPYTLTDEFGEVDIYMLPFIKRGDVRAVIDDEDIEIDTYTQAVRQAVRMMNVDRTKRNILLSHQFVTGAVRSESETVMVGGSDNVDPAAYEAFNYVALGHLHTAQFVDTGSETNTIYYCGTPLKYSFSEITDKSVAVVTLDGDGRSTVKCVPLRPLRDTRTITGEYREIIGHEHSSNDYIRVLLEDRETVPSHVQAQLRALFPNLVTTAYKYRLDIDTSTEALPDDEGDDANELDIFEAFFIKMNERGLTEGEREYMSALIDDIKEKIIQTKGGEL